jgi:hypothetical protein
MAYRDWWNEMLCMYVMIGNNLKVSYTGIFK